MSGEILEKFRKLLARRVLSFGVAARGEERVGWPSKELPIRREKRCLSPTTAWNHLPVGVGGSGGLLLMKGFDDPAFTMYPRDQLKLFRRDRQAGLAKWMRSREPAALPTPAVHQAFIHGWRIGRVPEGRKSRGQLTWVDSSFLIGVAQINNHFPTFEGLPTSG